MFKKGDVVQLKSGGPAMTVCQIGTQYDSTGVVCQFFDGSKKMEEIFDPETLSKIEN